MCVYNVYNIHTLYHTHDKHIYNIYTLFPSIYCILYMVVMPFWGQTGWVVEAPVSLQLAWKHSRVRGHDRLRWQAEMTGWDAVSSSCRPLALPTAVGQENETVKPLPLCSQQVARTLSGGLQSVCLSYPGPDWLTYPQSTAHSPRGQGWLLSLTVLVSSHAELMNRPTRSQEECVTGYQERLSYFI